MRISYQWLLELVDLDIVGGPHEVASALTRLGFALEEVETVGEDTILDLEVTTNRPDCLNHLGIARELAAQFGLRLRKPDLTAPEAALPASDFPARVEILDPELCPRYAARVLTDIKVEESPEWLRERLEALGQRPINNLVDITNYVLLELGHPLHAFDYENLQEGAIVVRRARQGEEIETLDGVRHHPGEEMLMICDADRPAAVAGVMGGADSEISGKTRTLLLESAYFDPASVRSTSKALGLRTEASYRFERGADPEMPVSALNRATRLIQELAGGRPVGPVIDQYPRPHRRRRVQLTPQRIQQVTGISMGEAQVERLLQALEFKVSRSNSHWDVVVPGFRVDVSLADDLVEELLRHFGYDKIEPTFPAAPQAGAFSATEEHDRIILGVLAGAGFHEVFTLAFTTPQKMQPYQDPPPPLVEISNPVSEEDTHLRRSLAPGLTQVVRHNLNHGNPDVRVFEMGRVFLEGEPVVEEERLGLASIGTFYDPYWQSKPEEYGFFHLKGVLERLFERLRLEAGFKPTREIPYLHPGAAAQVLLGSQSVGWIGRLHPSLESELKLPQPLYLAEISLTPVYASSLPQPQYEELGRFPAVERDFSFLVDKNTRFATIESAIKVLNVADLRNIQLIDFYQGPKIPAGKVNLTVRLTFANSARTLTQEEVSRLSSEVFDALQNTVDGLQPRT